MAPLGARWARSDHRPRSGPAARLCPTFLPAASRSLQPDREHPAARSRLLLLRRPPRSTGTGERTSEVTAFLPPSISPLSSDLHVPATRQPPAPGAGGGISSPGGRRKGFRDLFQRTTEPLRIPARSRALRAEGVGPPPPSPPAAAAPLRSAPHPLGLRAPPPNYGATTTITASNGGPQSRRRVPSERLCPMAKRARRLRPQPRAGSRGTPSPEACGASPARAAPRPEPRARSGGAAPGGPAAPRPAPPPPRRPARTSPASAAVFSFFRQYRSHRIPTPNADRSARRVKARGAEESCKRVTHGSAPRSPQPCLP